MEIASNSCQFKQQQQQIMNKITNINNFFPLLANNTLTSSLYEYYTTHTHKHPPPHTQHTTYTIDQF